MTTTNKIVTVVNYNISLFLQEFSACNFGNNSKIISNDHHKYRNMFLYFKNKRKIGIKKKIIIIIIIIIMDNSLEVFFFRFFTLPCYINKSYYFTLYFSLQVIVSRLVNTKHKCIIRNYSHNIYYIII